MPKRSEFAQKDFAQKLLDDLRLRKEKLGFAKSSPKSASKAYRNQGWSSQASREANSTIIGSKNMLDASVTKSWHGNRSKGAVLERHSQDIIPLSQGRKKEHTSDVSMGLTFALSSTGKLQNIELFGKAMMGNKLIMHRGSIDFRKTEHCITGSQRFATDQFPYLSDLRLGEVSKCVENLNNFLKECSSHPTITRDSIDIGRELLKGALDLEKSLGMLVTLEEASHYMVGSQNNNIKLLKAKEDESSSQKESQHKLKNKSTSSYVSSKNKHHSDMEKSSHTIVTGKSKALQSSSKEDSSNHSTQLVSHRRSLSCGTANILLPSLEEKSRCDAFTQIRDCYDKSYPRNYKESEGRPTVEKVRMPNVIARLMGLEELPELNTMGNNSESNMNCKLKQDRMMVKTLNAGTEISKHIDSTINKKKTTSKIDVQNKVVSGEGSVESKIKNIDQVESTKGMPHIEHQSDMQISIDKVNLSKDTGKGKIQVAQTKGGIETKEQESKGLTEGSASANERSIKNNPDDNHDIAVGKHTLAQWNMSPFVSGGSIDNKLTMIKINPSKETTKAKTSVAKTRESRSVTEMRAGRGAVPNHNGKTNYTMSKHVQGQEGRNLIVSSDLNTTSDIVSRKNSASYSSRSKAANENNRKTGNISNKKLQMGNAERSVLKLKKENVLTGKGKIKANGSSRRYPTKTNVAEQSKEVLKHTCVETAVATNRRIADDEHSVSTPERRQAEHGNFNIETNTDIPMTIAFQELATKTPLYTTFIQEKNILQLHAGEAGGERVKEEPLKIEALPEKGELSQASLIDEQGEISKGLLNKVGDETTMLGLTDSGQAVEKKTESDTPCNSHLIGTADLHAKAEAEEESSSEVTHSYQEISAISVAQKLEEISIEKDLEIWPLNMEDNHSKGPADKIQTSNFEHLEEQRNSVSHIEGQQVLNKGETILRQILLSSKPLLTTAKTLCKLEATDDCLQADGHESRQFDDNALVNCMDELMRRKCEREVVSYCGMTSKVAKERCLDDLIIELNSDIDILKILRNSENSEDRIAEQLHYMLEKDISGSNADINCMWDFGWNNMIFATVERDEIVTEVEKYMLKELMNDLVGEFLMKSIIVF